MICGESNTGASEYRRNTGEEGIGNTSTKHSIRLRHPSHIHSVGDGTVLLTVACIVIC
jgi:hypothetical protein